MRHFIPVAILWLVLAVPAAAGDIVGKPHVIDSDTIEVAGRYIRIFGIDAPDLGQTCNANGAVWSCGKEAVYALESLVGDKEVACVGDRRSLGRCLVAKCYVGTHDVARVVIFRGWALAHRETTDEYVPEEDDARVHKRGLWRGAFTPPWTYRKNLKLAEPVCNE